MWKACEDEGSAGLKRTSIWKGKKFYPFPLSAFHSALCLCFWTSAWMRGWQRNTNHRFNTGNILYFQQMYTFTRAPHRARYSSCVLPFISFEKTLLVSTNDVCVCDCVKKKDEKSYFLFPLWEIVSCQRFKAYSHPKMTGFLREKHRDVYCALKLELRL